MPFVEREERRPVIDLQGQDGNAFVLLGRARQYGKELGFSEEKITNLLNDMKSSDYRHLVDCFMEAFGEVVDVIPPDNWN